ncbi:MAG: ABC transporter substrate-binding protein, partial [Candidatus Dormibacteria bacterium]
MTSTAVTVGGLAPLTSLRSATLPGTDIGAEAYFNKINAHGGVNGRMIDFVGVQDDGDDPIKNLQAAQVLVQQNHVFGLVPVVTPDMGSAPFLEKSQVPAVGQLFDSQACQKTYLFGINGCTSPPASSRIFSPSPGVILKQGVFHGQSGRTVAITVDDTPAGHQSSQSCTGPFTSTGFKVVGTFFVPASSTVADFQPYAQQLLHSDRGKPPDVVWTCDSFSTAIGVTAALKSSDFQGALYNSVAYDPRLLQVPLLRQALQGTYVYTNFSPVESNTAAMRGVRGDIHASAPLATISVEVLAGYYSAELFTDILKNAGKKLTAQGFAEAGNNNFTFDAGGALCPVTF